MMAEKFLAMSGFIQFCTKYFWNVSKILQILFRKNDTSSEWHSVTQKVCRIFPRKLQNKAAYEQKIKLSKSSMFRFSVDFSVEQKREVKRVE